MPLPFNTPFYDAVHAKGSSTNAGDEFQELGFPKSRQDDIEDFD
jgi:hypothetical protein